MPTPNGQQGQASVELVTLLPLIALVGALLWQAVVAGQALWLAGAAARAAARAAAVGGAGAAEPAARAALPPRLAHGLAVRTDAGGRSVRVTLRIPSVLTGGALTTTDARAAFPEQGG
jgi:hypothetical protein